MHMGSVAAFSRAEPFTEKALITAGVSDEIELGIEQFRRGERIVVDIDSL